jgi:predicted nucleic acid-binding protein
MANLSKKIFVDSSAFIAFIDRASKHHYQAIDTFQKLAYEQCHLFSSNLILYDTHDRLLSEFGGATAKEFLSTILESNIKILQTTKGDTPSALKLLNFYSDREIKIIDFINAILMNKNGINQIFTFNYWSNLIGSTALVL